MIPTWLLALVIISLIALPLIAFYAGRADAYYEHWYNAWLDGWNAAQQSRESTLRSLD